MIRKVLIGVIIVVILGGGAFVAIYTMNQPRVTPEIIDEDTHNHPADGEEDGVVIVNGSAVNLDAIQRSYQPAAELAAEAYLNQSSDESDAARRIRLQSFFSEDSSAPSAPRPNMNLNTSTTHSVTASTLYSDYTATESSIIVSVALAINLRTSESENLSTLYRTYDVELKWDGMTYTPASISLSRIPVVISEDQ